MCNGPHQVENDCSIFYTTHRTFTAYQQTSDSLWLKLKCSETSCSSIVLSISHFHSFQISPLLLIENHCHGNNHLILPFLMHNNYYDKHGGKWQKHTQLSIISNMLFFSCSHSKSFHGVFSSVEAVLNSPCNFHQANKGKQWYINQEQSPSARRSLHLTFCFTQARDDPLLNPEISVFVCHPF